MGGWGGIEEHELEEGEAADDDSSIDLNALSYLDEKLQNVLGHLQKDFEGVVTVEQLGPKFGDYGSFLPVHQRTPPTRSQPKTPPRVQNHSTSRSHGNFPIESGPQNRVARLDAPVSQTCWPSAPSNTDLINNSKSLSVDGSVRQESCPVAKKMSATHEPSFGKPVKQPGHKKLTVRIKVRSDKEEKRNAAIYSGLGLTSPSSSAGNSLDESCGTPFSSKEIPSECPTSILQIFTSLPVPEDLLLSPLHHNLLNLIRTGKTSVNSNSVAPVKARQINPVSFVDNSASMLETYEASKAKKSKFVGMDENNEQLKHENQLHSLDKKNAATENLESRQSYPVGRNVKSSSDLAFDAGLHLRGAAGQPEVVRQPELNIPVKKREINKDGLKDRLLANDLNSHEPLKSLHVQDSSKFDHQESRSSAAEKSGEPCVRSSQKGGPFYLKEDSRSKGNRNVASIKADSDIPEEKLDSAAPVDHSKYRGPKAASHKATDSGMLNAEKNASKKFPLEGKKKLKGSQVDGRSTSNLADATLKSRVSAVKDKKSAQKDVNRVCNSYKDLLDTRLDHVGNQADLSARPSVEKSKDSGREGISGKRGVGDKDNQSSGLNKFDNQLGSEMSTKEPLTDNIPLNGHIAGVDFANELWVCCDKCGKWRLLPPGVTNDMLPDKWLCKMQDWLPGMNSCDFSQDDTTAAFRAKFYVLEPQNCLQNGAELQLHQNVGFHDMADPGKKKLNSKEGVEMSNIYGPIMGSYSMKNPRQDTIRTAKDMSQPSPEANLIPKSNKNMKKSYLAMGRHLSSGVEDHVTRGDVKPKMKIKRGRESDQYGQESAKKMKVQVSTHMDDLYAPEYDGHLGRIGVTSSSGLPSKEASKDKQKQMDQKEGDKLKIFVKKRKDSLQGSLDSGSIDVKNDLKGTSRKKRKVIDGQDHLEQMRSNVNNFKDTKGSLKEDSDDSVFRKEKKSKLLGSEGKGFSSNNGDDKSSRKGTGTTVLLSGNRADRSGNNVKKAQQLRAKIASGLTLEDIEALRKDLGSEQLSTAATSSSSKVSDSRMSRANYLEVKGSPVESVSSSPMRTSTVNNHSVPHRETPENTILGSQENNSRGVTTLSWSGTPHLDNTDGDTSVRHSPCPSDVHAKARHSSKARISHDHMLNRQKSGIVSSARSNENGKASAFGFERVEDKISDSACEQEILHQRKTSREETGTEHNHRASRNEVVGDSNQPFSDESNLKGFRIDDNVPQKNFGKGLDSWKWSDMRGQSQPKDGTGNRSDVKVGTVFDVDGRANSMHNLRDAEAEIANKSIPNQVERNGKLKVSSHSSGTKSAKDSQRGSSPLAVQPLGASVGEGLKVSKAAANGVHQNSTNGSMSHPASDAVQDLSGPSHTKKETSTQGAASALNEAEKLRDTADRLKESGFGFECNEAYFQAALMFLHGASLLDSSSESAKHGELNQMQIYGSTAKLCENCALEYEKGQEMASAALAYKCMEVAYLRVVYYKHMSANRVWRELQGSLLMIPQSESPSSSASDIDNINNPVATEKAVLCKGNGSLAGSHVIAPQNRPNFVRLLDFTKDASFAMEASRKTQDAYAAAANMMLDQAQNKEIIISVKRVVDFSFQDVEELVRLVKHAMGVISRGGFGGS